MLHHLLKNAVEIDPTRPSVESDGSWTTAADLERLAARLASGLAAAGLEEAGVGPGRGRKSTRPGANGVVELTPLEFVDRLA